MALTMAACSSDDNIVAQSQSAETAVTIPFEATIGNSTGTRGLTENSESKAITAKWEVGEKVALIHGETIDVMNITKVDDNGVATIRGGITSTESAPVKNGDGVFVVYFGSEAQGMTDFTTGLQAHYALSKLEYNATAIDEVDDIFFVADSLVHANQDGTLETINARLDMRLAQCELAVDDDNVATFAKDVTLSSLFAIWKLSLTDGSTSLKAKTFKMDVGSDSYTLTLNEPTSELYTIFSAADEGAYAFRVTDTDDKSYVKFLEPKKSLKEGKYYQSTIALTQLDDVEYVAYSADGTATTKTVAPKDYTLISGEVNTYLLTGGWYVVTGNTTLVNSWSPESDVNIILCDGATLSFDNMLGFQGRRLAIYGQSKGTGKFNISTDNNDYCLVASALEIHGGEIAIKGVNSTNGISISGSVEVPAQFAMYHGTLTVETGSTALTISPIDTKLILGKGQALYEGGTLDQLEIAEDQTYTTKACMKIAAFDGISLEPLSAYEGGTDPLDTPISSPISISTSTRSVLAEATDGKSITNAWNSGDEVALKYEIGGDLHVTKATVILLQDNTAVIKATFDEGVTDGDIVKMVYPYSAVNTDVSSYGEMKHDLFTSQLGTLEDIGANRNLHSGEGTISVADGKATLKENVEMKSDIAIWKLTLTTDGSTALTTKKLTVKVNTEAVATVKTGNAGSEFYVALDKSFSDATVTITAEGSDGKDYIYSNSGVTIEMGKFYQSKLKMSLSGLEDYNVETEKNW